MTLYRQGIKSNRSNGCTSTVCMLPHVRRDSVQAAIGDGIRHGKWFRVWLEHEFIDACVAVISDRRARFDDTSCRIRVSSHDCNTTVIQIREHPI